MKLKRIILGMIAAAICAASVTSCAQNNSNSDSSSESKEATSEAVITEEEKENETIRPTGGNIGEVTISKGDTVAEIVIDGYGTIKAKLFPDIAPIGVKNFTMLAEQGFYNDTNFHRVISNFMMQGGALNRDGTGGDAAYSGEGSDATSFGTEVNENARHFYGALCYANALGQNSTQFYIVNNKNPQDLSEVSADDIAATAEQAKAYKEQCEQGTQVYSYYEAMEKQYSNLAEWLRNTSDKVAEKYLQGGVYYLDGGYTVFGQVVEGFDVIDSISEVKVTENANGESSRPVNDIVIKTVKVYTAE